MKWWPRDCVPGDIIRIQLGEIYHYGIFVSEEEIIQFGSPPVNLKKLADEDIRVCVTDIQNFSIGRMVEAADFSFSEKLKKNSPKKIIEIARSQIGSGGYNLLHNNCEHFVNFCAFGIKVSNQEQSVIDKWKNRPVLDIYISKIPENVCVQSVIPEERNLEIQNVKNETAKQQKYWVWKTLEYGLFRTYALPMENADFSKTKKGKWLCNKCYFSMSHTKNLVAVAVSNKPVGIDVENVAAFADKKHKLKSLADRIVNPVEAQQINDEITIEQFLALWTQKEAAYKAEEKQHNFNPSKMELNPDYIYTKTEKLDDVEYCLSVYSELKASIHFYNFKE